MFLIFGKSEAQRSYKHGSYKKSVHCTVFEYAYVLSQNPSARQLRISTHALEEETGGLQPIRIDYNCYSLQSEKRILKVKLCVKFSAFLGRIDFVYRF